MAGKVIKSSFVFLSKFAASRQERASKTATSHIRKPLYTILAMRYFLLTLILFTQLACSQVNSQKTQEQAKSSDVKTIDDIDGSLENVSYVANGGIITDTIFHDELQEKIKIGFAIEIDSTIYISYSKYSLENTLKYDMSFYFDGHFINTVQGNSIPGISGELLDLDSLNFMGPALELGDGCGHDDVLRISEFKLANRFDSSIYILAEKPECSDGTNHILIKYVNNQFDKLFELETTQDNVNFKLEGDSLITCIYSQFYEDWDESYDFAYDLRNSKIVRDTVYNRR
ncbi:MAG: hypothetical protein RIF36_11630 [Imperialibacter sp.]|uniref:hypothetical protein n=1 Tax=Imperialibacter sp. TaxID=2038411 RepID=UPI0032EB27A7